MYEPIWAAASQRISCERMAAEVARYFALSRWSSFDKINALAEMIAGDMRAAGLEDVRLIRHPADGRTFYAGWVMPQAYDVRTARLRLVTEDRTGDELEADYGQNPTCLCLYSMPTSPGGVTAGLVVADSVDECLPERIHGRLVLTRERSIAFSQAAMQAGALGLIVDARVAVRFLKEAPLVDICNEWLNYTIAPWRDAGKGFGFSISPERGAMLRERLARGLETVRHAEVDTVHYDGVLPVVSGLLRGASAEEVVITGHYDEFGADDNCSQIAVGLEALRAIGALVRDGALPPLRRTIRLLFPMEVRGFNALVQDADEVRNMRIGLNIDTVGTDQNRSTTYCTLAETFPALPSFADELAADLLARVARENPLFRWKRTHSELIDNVFGEPLIGAPTPAIYHFSATHHLNADTPRTVSPRMLCDMARVTATYAAFLANAGPTEARWLCALVAQTGAQRMRDVAARALHAEPDAAAAGTLMDRIDRLHAEYGRRLESVEWIVDGREHRAAVEAASQPSTDASGWNAQASSADIERHRTSVQNLRERLASERDSALADVAATFRSLHGLDVPPPPTEFRSACAPSSAPKSVAQPDNRTSGACVPTKLIRGFIGFEDLGDEERKRVEQLIGEPIGWGAPMWLQVAAMLADGTRTVESISAALVEAEYHTPGVDKLEELFKVLASRGTVNLRAPNRADPSRAAG